MPRCQVLRPALGQAAQVDDLLDAGVGGGLAEVPGRALVAFGEVTIRRPATHRVHEVVGDLHAIERRAQRVGLQHIPRHHFAAGRLEVLRLGGIANEAAHVRPLARELGREQAADVAGRAGDQELAIRIHPAATTRKALPVAPAGDLAQLRLVVARPDGAHGAGTRAHHQ